ncbi:DUF2249 domain-containing protein [Opitutus terrae]|uniref:DUF2249 domain-containing protein n=1 Tax=Opitutus terrae (strain DSM 11246 / JCM 15787 / PB90-1) TaxID=452637 RepID=B1ZWR3_OPITP|nr:DUF2249 domain-containing protein [Opitutus terrae]ACB74190.1 conserved hypothetical protein [Opitutus terrae PB90-1]
MNNATTEPNASAYLDVREVSCREKHPLIFRRWTELPVGSYFVLVNDHDPVPLYYQFAGQFPGAFTWEYLVEGPDEFQVKITRIAATESAPAVRPPAGGCGSTRNEAILDARGLEPPEPMLRIMAAIETLASGAQLRALTDRKPVHLLAELDTRGFTHASHEQADGSWLNTIKKN